MRCRKRARSGDDPSGSTRERLLEGIGSSAIAKIRLRELLWRPLLTPIRMTKAARAGVSAESRTGSSGRLLFRVERQESSLTRFDKGSLHLAAGSSWEGGNSARFLALTP